MGMMTLYSIAIVSTPSKQSSRSTGLASVKPRITRFSARLVRRRQRSEGSLTAVAREGGASGGTTVTKTSGLSATAEEAATVTTCTCSDDAIGDEGRGRFGKGGREQQIRRGDDARVAGQGGSMCYSMTMNIGPGRQDRAQMRTSRIGFVGITYQVPSSSLGGRHAPTGRAALSAASGPACSESQGVGAICAPRAPSSLSRHARVASSRKAFRPTSSCRGSGVAHGGRV